MPHPPYLSRMYSREIATQRSPHSAQRWHYELLWNAALLPVAKLATSFASTDLATKLLVEILLSRRSDRCCRLSSEKLRGCVNGTTAFPPVRK